MSHRPHASHLRDIRDVPLSIDDRNSLRSSLHGSMCAVAKKARAQVAHDDVADHVGAARSRIKALRNWAGLYIRLGGNPEDHGPQVAAEAARALHDAIEALEPQEQTHERPQHPEPHPQPAAPPRDAARQEPAGPDTGGRRARAAQA